MDVNTFLQWQALITQAVGLGVKSWEAIHLLLQDAGHDDATIATLKPKWDLLVDDVRRAAGNSPVQDRGPD